MTDLREAEASDDLRESAERLLDDIQACNCVKCVDAVVKSISAAIEADRAKLGLRTQTMDDATIGTPKACPVPVQEDYVRRLLLLSSCFGKDRDGKPLVCHTEPCACAQSLLQEIGKPLWLKIERLRVVVNDLMENMGGHHHWDVKGTSGANCPICQLQRRAQDRARAILTESGRRE